MNFKRHVLQKEIKFPVHRYQKVLPRLATYWKITAMVTRNQFQCVLCVPRHVHSLSSYHTSTESQVWADISGWTFYRLAPCALLSFKSTNLWTSKSAFSCVKKSWAAPHVRSPLMFLKILSCTWLKNSLGRFYYSLLDLIDSVAGPDREYCCSLV